MRPQSDQLVRPQSDQLEVSFFGPGFGECVLVHLGSDHWITVDSCINPQTKSPVAIEYLEELGIDPKSAIKLIVATHWHDDHVRGLSRVFERAASASFAASAALNQREFLTLVRTYDGGSIGVAGAGTSEMSKCLEHALSTSRTIKRTLARKQLHYIPADELSHGFECGIDALSPSDAQFDLFLREVGSMLPQAHTTKRRAASQSPNHMAIVLRIRIGAVSFLLGADLEESGDPALGWSAIVNDYQASDGTASVFKIPHHGSVNGHHPDVWRRMLTQEPHSVLTPWSRGGGLPGRSDVGRVNKLTSNAYSTSNFAGRVRRRANTVEKQIELTVRKLVPIQSRCGRVTIRNGGAKAFDTWTATVTSPACRLAEYTFPP